MVLSVKPKMTKKKVKSNFKKKKRKNPLRNVTSKKSNVSVKSKQTEQAKSTVTKPKKSLKIQTSKHPIAKAVAYAVLISVLVILLIAGVYALKSISIIAFAILGIMLSIVLCVFWFWMLIDCILRDIDKKVNKILWFLLILFTDIIGALVYYFIVYRKDK